MFGGARRGSRYDLSHDDIAVAVAVSTRDAESIAEELRLCEEANLSFRSSEEAKGQVPERELEKLRLKAEFHYRAVSAYLLRDLKGNDEIPH
ncbi:hypothetical protein D3C76_930390 [compost metagenome]